MNGISKDTFQGMDIQSQQNVLFDYAVDTNKAIKELNEKLDALRLTSARWGGIGGLIIAMLAAVGKFLFFNGK